MCHNSLVPQGGKLNEAGPRTVGRYEIRRELGRGTMGIVYEAHDPDIRRTVALKTIHPAILGSPAEQQAFETRFFAEARMAGQLSHPGIVTVYDVGRDSVSGILYIALEHLRGQTLAQMTAWRQPMEWRDAFRIAARLADALHHAHTHGIVHRDLKPGNVMLLDSGEPKIMDFGIAKAETARFKLTATGSFLGTPLYVAPEQAEGGAVDGRTDVFSLGSILYTLLTGRPAFEAANIPSIVARVLNDDPAPPSTRVPDVPAEADYVLARALAKASADRYPTALAFKEDAEDVLARRPPRHREGWTPPPRRAPGTPSSVPATDESALEGIDLEAELAMLVPDVEAPGAGVATVPSPPRGGAASRKWGRGVIAAAAAAAVVLSLGIWRRSERPRPAASAAPSSREPPAAAPSVPIEPLPRPGPTEQVPAAPPAESPEATVVLAPTSQPPGTPRVLRPQPLGASPARPRALVPVSGAELAIDLEHHIKRGQVRVWVDDTLVLEEPIDASEPKKVLAFRTSSGSLRDVLVLLPGEHRVRVGLEWEGAERMAQSTTVFAEGATRRLQVRQGGFLRKGLALEWR